MVWTTGGPGFSDRYCEKCGTWMVHRIIVPRACWQCEHCGSIVTSRGGDPTRPGKFYERDRFTGRLTEHPPCDPDVWICRRVEDFPRGLPPEGSAVERCTRCGTYIAFNPLRFVRAPKVCMQCAGITPDPFEG